MNEFLKNINEKNPLGTGGKLICSYAELMKEMWQGTSFSVSPWKFKNIIGKYASQFSGYS